MTFKKIINQLHLWLGFTSGLVVFVVSITGSIYAFQEEIQALTQPFRKVKPQAEAFLPPSRLKELAEQQLPGKKIHGVMYSDRTKAAVVSFYNNDPKYYYLVYLNPYSGELLKVKDANADFFGLVLRGHFYLWLPDKIGQPVVASFTLIFLVMLITGLILWWPKNKKAAKQRFSVKWSAKWRRRNYDLHNVLGFYMTWIVIFIALTGLTWGFEWFSKGTYWLISGGKELIEYSEPLSDTTNVMQSTELSAPDKIWFRMKSELKQGTAMEIHFPETKESPVLVEYNPHPDTYYKIDYRFFDQYSLNELKVDHRWGKYSEATIEDKIFRMNYDIHVGGILGLPGKCIAFFASLIAASLPITGFYIWWGRRKKGKVGQVVKSKKSPKSEKEGALLTG